MANAVDPFSFTATGQAPGWLVPRLPIALARLSLLPEEPRSLEGDPPMMHAKQLGPLVAVALISTSASARTVTLNPVADTYLEVGTEATWDHGKCTYFDVDTKPSGVSYLKFDLSGIPASEQVASATLTLHCTNSSNDGGTIYPVSSGADWSEGDRCGAGGSGLKWADVDCNGDGKITSADFNCPTGVNELLPLFDWPIATLGSVSSGKSYTRDVTAWFGGVRGGGGPVNLAIVSNSSDGATYRSREYSTVSQRPVVQLELEDVPSGVPNDRCERPTVVTSTDFTETLDTRGAPSYDDWDPYPLCTGQPAPYNVWYSYTAPTNGMVMITTTGSTYDTGVAVYVGTCHRDVDTVLTEVACAADVCFGDGRPSQAAFYVEPGTTYLIMVWDEKPEHPASGGGGTLVFHLSQFDGCPG
jgi:hypothetical protein